MKRVLVILTVLVMALSSSGCSKKGKNDVVAVVNGKKITMAMVDERIASLPAQYQVFAGQHKKEMVDEMVSEELLFAEAKKRGVERLADVKDLIDKAVRKVLVAKVIDDITKKAAPVSEEDAKSDYERNKERYMVPEMVRASHILTNTEEEAKEAKAELNAGKDFAETAKKYSRDLTKDRGGDLGFFMKGQMIPEFETAAFALNVGQVSDIVKTRFGYHIIKVTEKKPATFRKFEEIQDNIMALLSRQRQKDKFDEFLNVLKKKAHIKVFDDKLAPAPEPVKEEDVTQVEAEAPSETQNIEDIVVTPGQAEEAPASGKTK